MKMKFNMKRKNYLDGAVSIFFLFFIVIVLSMISNQNSLGWERALTERISRLT